jgi:hypothetical protein
VDFFYLALKANLNTMLELNVKNESLRLRTVVLQEPPLAMVLCQQWQRHTTKIVRAHFSGTYPEEIDMVAEMDAFNKEILQRYDVVVWAQIDENYNQIFYS